MYVVVVDHRLRIRPNMEALWDGCVVARRCRKREREREREMDASLISTSFVASRCREAIFL